MSRSSYGIEGCGFRASLRRKSSRRSDARERSRTPIEVCATGSGERSMATENRIHLRQAEIGPMANFIYIIGDLKTRKAAVVDPAWDVDAILEVVNRDGYEIDKILITHYHQDH